MSKVGTPTNHPKSFRKLTPFKIGTVIYPLCQIYNKSYGPVFREGELNSRWWRRCGNIGLASSRLICLGLGRLCYRLLMNGSRRNPWLARMRCYLRLSGRGLIFLLCKRLLLIGRFFVYILKVADIFLIFLTKCIRGENKKVFWKEKSSMCFSKVEDEMRWKRWIGKERKFLKDGFSPHTHSKENFPTGTRL